MILSNPDLPRLVVPGYDPFISLPKKPKPKDLPVRLKRRAAGAKRRARTRR